MRLLVDKITDISKAYKIHLSADTLNSQLNQAQDDTLGLFASEAMISYRLSRIGRRLLLSGELAASLAMQCGRCLTAMNVPLNETFSIALNIIDEEPSVAEELELDVEQINSISQVGGEIDLLPILQEQLVTSLPMHKLCRENCSGLCPYCGVDLNENNCACEPRHFNNRFGKLKDLKLDPS